jgi:hypothetical protein
MKQRPFSSKLMDLNRKTPYKLLNFNIQNNQIPAFSKDEKHIKNPIKQMETIKSAQMENNSIKFSTNRNKSSRSRPSILTSGTTHKGLEVEINEKYDKMFIKDKLLKKNIKGRLVNVINKVNLLNLNNINPEVFFILICSCL